MPSLPVTDADIRAHTAGGSYDRGKEYYHDGAVKSLTLDDENTLKAQVQGSDVHPYIVQIQFDADDVTRVECTCPYLEGSWCKHIAATLLQALDADEIPKSEAAAVANKVRDLDREALVELLQGLAERNPDLIDEIEEVRPHLQSTP